jgi:hypothetical protein
MIRYMITAKYMLVFLVILLVSACASAPKTFDEAGSDPQILMVPETLRLGIARVLGTDMVCRGRGFAPGERVFVQMTGIEDANREEEIGLCSADADDQGCFTATVESSNKIFSILHASLLPRKKGLAVRSVDPPIPTGVYLVTAEGLSSKNKAESRMRLTGPSIGDRIKDWLGGKLGKIVTQ